MHAATQKTRGALSRNGKRKHTDCDGASHHKSQGWVPQTGKVQKTQHFAGVRHARHDEAQAKHEANQKFRDSMFQSSAPMKLGACQASAWRMRNTVTNPAPMKANVAINERGDMRDSPHTPCPLVQPEP